MRHKTNSVKIVIRAIFTFILLLAIIFVPAGSFDYRQGWVLFGNYVLKGIIGFILFKDKKEVKYRLIPMIW